MRTSRKDRALAKIRRDVLLPATVKYDLDYDDEIVRPGERPPCRAFNVLSGGFEFLLEITGPGGFPSSRGRARRRGARLVKKKLLYTGLDSLTYLMHAHAALMAKLEGALARDGSDDDRLRGAGPHAQILELLQDFYPLRGGGLRPLLQEGMPLTDILRPCFAEFDVMDTHEPRPEVAEGSQRASRYSQCLLDGNNPDDDPELVEEQKRYARDYYINEAARVVVRVALQAHRPMPPSYYPLVENDIAELAACDEGRGDELRARSLAAWIAGSQSYREFVLESAITAPARG